MKNPTFLFVIVVFVLLQTTSQAQTKQTAAREFLKQLNEIVAKTSEPWPWNYEGKYSVDSAFALSSAGILSITFRYTTDTAFTRIRMIAPVGKIKDVFYDYYLGFQFNQDWVTVYQTMPGSNRLEETKTNHLFHVGMPSYDGEHQKERLKKALVEVQKYYN